MRQHRQRSKKKEEPRSVIAKFNLAVLMISWCCYEVVLIMYTVEPLVWPILRGFLWVESPSGIWQLLCEKEPSGTSGSKAGHTSPSVNVRRLAVDRNAPFSQLVADITRQISAPLHFSVFIRQLKVRIIKVSVGIVNNLSVDSSRPLFHFYQLICVN